MVTKIFFPKIRLQEMLNRPGGISRDEALSAAIENVRSLSAEGDQQIEETIAKIETILLQRVKISAKDLKAILAVADQIVTLAGTFGYFHLDRATKALCDIADCFLQAGKIDAPAVLVHARAVRLFAPSASKLSDAAANEVLLELEKIKSFFKFGSTA